MLFLARGIYPEPGVILLPGFAEPGTKQWPNVSAMKSTSGKEQVSNPNRLPLWIYSAKC